MTRREIIELRIARGVWAGASADDYLRERTAADRCRGHVDPGDERRPLDRFAHVPMPDGGWVCTHEDITERRRRRRPRSRTWPATTR